MVIDLQIIIINILNINNDTIGKRFPRQETNIGNNLQFTPVTVYVNRSKNEICVS